MSALLEVEDLSVEFATDDGMVSAVDGVTLSARAGEILGIVGESGSGKSVLISAILRLVRPPGRIVSGRLRFEGNDLLALPAAELEAIRGARIALVPQTPRTSLNPLMTVGRQIERLLRLHRGMDKWAAREAAIAMLERVRIPDPKRRAGQYAHELSGGMCQRVMIAMALATEPRLLLADEPTTGLDVSIGARILELLRQLGEESGAAIILVTHDLGVVAQTCHRVAVMHAGQLSELAEVDELFERPLHPYTQALVRSIPRIDREIALSPIAGAVPSLINVRPGCRYVRRCPEALAACRRQRPALIAAAGDHRVACHAMGQPHVVR